jgi:hypothetical protein
MLGKFNALQTELSRFEYPDRKEACQEAIIAQTSRNNMNIEQLSYFFKDDRLVKS